MQYVYSKLRASHARAQTTSDDLGRRKHKRHTDPIPSSQISRSTCILVHKNVNIIREAFCFFMLALEVCLWVQGSKWEKFCYTK